MGSLKKLWGWYPTDSAWLPIKVDANGKVVLSSLSSGLIPQYLIAKWDYANGAIPTGWSLYADGDYSADLLTGGTASADSEFGAGYEAAKACDDNAATKWVSTVTAFPHFWKYDFVVSYIIRQLTIKSPMGTGGIYLKDFTLQGSINNADWTTVYTGQMANNENVQTFTFDNSNSYRYYKINGTSMWNADATTTMQIWECEMMELATINIIKG